MIKIITDEQVLIAAVLSLVVGWLLRMLYQWEVVERKAKNANDEGQDTPSGL